MQRMGLSREDNDGTAGGGEDTSSSNGGETPLRVETRSVFNIKLGIFGMVKMVKKATVVPGCNISRVRNLLAKFREFCVYEVIKSHSRKPKIGNMSPKFSKLAKG